MLTLRMMENGGLDLRGGRGPVLVDGAEAAQAQCLALGWTQQGEWSFNLEFGLDYDALLGRFFDDGTAATLVAGEYSDLSAVSVIAADAVTFAQDTDARQLSYTIDPVFPIGVTDTNAAFAFVGPEIE